jgi:hypothetical protein
MNETPAAKLFKEPAIWPSMAPWWLLPSTEAAALLNVKPATLHTWRVRGYGPPVFPPMYVRPTQGNPLYYQFGALRNWAASKLGMAFPYDDQCFDFFRKYCPQLVSGTGGVEGRIKIFNRMFEEERRNAQQGRETIRLSLGIVQELDLGFSRQPKITMPKHRTGTIVYGSLVESDISAQ